MSYLAENTSDGLRERTERLEEAFLAAQATRSYSARRSRFEPESAVRTPFQRDRDRIVHSKAFRRLKHKTQVFISPEGDHYRTRLTHTLETCGIARTVARVLGLNEDLTEAIGVGHDLGHPPFGHIGETVLDSCLAQHYDTRFHHNRHSLRIVERLERDGDGLNLTEQVRDGILNHTGDSPPATLEGQVVKLVDRIAYINHDIDDALRAGVLTSADLPARELEILGRTGSERIDTLVRDVVQSSRSLSEIRQGDTVGEAMLRLREFMFENVYLAQPAQQEYARIERMLSILFSYYADNIPEPVTTDATDAERVTDYLAGMTDRYAIRVFYELAVPHSF